MTVAATSPALPETKPALTDNAGKCVIDALPPGFYTLTFYFGQFVVERRDVDVKSSAQVIVDQTIDVCRKGGPTVVFSKCGDLKTACRALEVNTDYVTNGPTRTESELTRGASRCPHSNRCGFERELPPCD